MSRSVVLIFLVIGLAAAGGGFYFFKVYMPAQDLKKAQAEVSSWEERFGAARDCLLGKTPGSAKTSEALAIREMTPDPWDRGKCTPLISKLSRGDAPDTGIPTVEQAWTALDKAASKAALAFARHVSESTTLREDPLPTALDELDAARNALRAAAKMPAATTGGQPLATAELAAMLDGDQKLEELVVDSIPSAGGLVLFGKTGNRMVQVNLAPGVAPRLQRVGPGTVRSVPDGTWGAIATPDAVKAGALDLEGVMATPTAFNLPGPTIAAVAGSLADGYIVFGNPVDLVIARAKDGTVTAAPAVKIDLASAGVDLDGRAAVVWTSAGTTKAQVLKPGGEEPVIEIPHATGAICLTRDRAWTQTDEGAVGFGFGKPTLKKGIGAGTRLQGCTGEAALFHDHVRHDERIVCADECRSVKMPAGAPEMSATTVVGGKLVALASHAGVLGVWREGAKPVFYALPDGQAKPVLAHEWPAMALTDGKVIDVIARGAKGFTLIRVPAGA